MLIVLGGRTALSCYQLEFVGSSDICDSVLVGGRVCVCGLEGEVGPTWALFLTVRIVTLTVILTWWFYQNCRPQFLF